MNTVPAGLDVPKESKEVVDCLVAVVKDVKAKKSLAEDVSDALPKLIVAIDGFDQLGDEAKSANKSDLAAYLVKQLLDALGA